MIFCSLYSGSSGNSIFVSSGNTKILVDAGLSGKTIEKAFSDIGENPRELDGIFITHEHSDHIKGVGILSRKYDIPIYANELTWRSMESAVGNVKESNVRVITEGNVCIKDMDVVSYGIPHDASDPVGYAFYHNNKKVAIATDIGYFSENVKNAIKDADVILLESNHDIEMVKFGPYPYPLKRRILSNVGHLSNEDCGKAIADIIDGKQKRVILGHLSKTNNYPELAYQTVINVLNEKNIKLNEDVTVGLAKRDEPSSFIEF